MDIDGEAVSDGAASDSGASNDGASVEEDDSDEWEDVLSNASDVERDDVDNVLGMISDSGGDRRAEHAEEIMPPSLLDLEAAAKRAKGRARDSTTNAVDSEQEEDDEHEDDTDGDVPPVSNRETNAGRESRDVNTQAPATTDARKPLAPMRAGQLPVAHASSSAMLVEPQTQRGGDTPLEFSASFVRTPASTGCAAMMFKAGEWVRCNDVTFDRNCGTLRGTWEVSPGPAADAKNPGEVTLCMVHVNADLTQNKLLTPQQRLPPKQNCSRI